MQQAPKKDVRWFYAGIVASTIFVAGSSLALYPSIICGNSNWFITLCVRGFGSFWAFISAAWFDYYSQLLNYHLLID